MSAPLDEVLITAELLRRAAHAPDFAAENRAFAAPATEMASQPHRVLHKLAELVIELCGADSAGISILGSGDAGHSFRWHATAGAFSRSLGAILPRHASPCGIVVERGATRLFDAGDARLLQIETQAQLRAAVSVETVGVLFLKLSGTLADANPAFEHMSGYRRDELLALPDWHSLTPPEFLEIAANAAHELEDTGHTAPFEKQMLRQDSSRFWGLCAPARVVDSGALRPGFPHF